MIYILAQFKNGMFQNIFLVSISPFDKTLQPLFLAAFQNFAVILLIMLLSDKHTAKFNFILMNVWPGFMSYPKIMLFHEKLHSLLKFKSPMPMRSPATDAVNVKQNLKKMLKARYLENMLFYYMYIAQKVVTFAWKLDSVHGLEGIYA